MFPWIYFVVSYGSILWDPLNYLMLCHMHIWYLSIHNVRTSLLKELFLWFSTVNTSREIDFTITIHMTLEFPSGPCINFTSLNPIIRMDKIEFQQLTRSSSYSSEVWNVVVNIIRRQIDKTCFALGLTIRIVFFSNDIC